MRLIRKTIQIAKQFMRWLFLAGNEFTVYSGGWVPQAWSGNAAIWNQALPDCVNTGTVLRILMGNIYMTGQSGVVRPNNAIDLTHVSTIRMRMTYSLADLETADNGYQRIYMFTSSDTSGNWTSDNTAISLKVEHGGDGVLAASNVDFTLDVTSLTGLHYICAGYVWRYQTSASTVDIVEVELIP